MSKFFKALEQAERDRALKQAQQPHDEDRTDTDLESTTSSASAHVPHQQMPVDREQERPSLAYEVPEGNAFPSSPVTTPNGIDQHLVSLLAPTSFEAEQYRGLRHVVEQIRLTAGTSVVGVTSATMGDGKTITAINLAGALAQAQSPRVLLIETDLRRPSLARYLGLPHRGVKGLVDAILEPDAPFDSFVTSLPQFRLAVLPAGRSQLTSYELLKAPHLEALFDEARKQYDYVVVDTLPLIPLSDCRLILKLVDTMLLVVAAHQTPRKLLEEALNVLDSAKVLGIVFNNDDRPLAGYYYRYNYYQEGEQETRRGRRSKRLMQLLRRPR